MDFARAVTQHPLLPTIATCAEAFVPGPGVDSDAAFCDLSSRCCIQLICRCIWSNSACSCSRAMFFFCTNARNRAQKYVYMIVCVQLVAEWSK